MPDQTVRTPDSGRQTTPLPLPIRLIDRLSAFSNALAATALVLLALNVFFDVVGRTSIHASIAGTLDMTIYWWMPSLSLFAFAYTERVQEHIKVTILLDTLPLRLRQIVEGVFSLLAAGLLALVTWYSWISAMRSARIGEMTSSSPPVTIWLFKFVAVAGIGAMCLQLIATAYRHFTGRLSHAPDLAHEEVSL